MHLGHNVTFSDDLLGLLEAMAYASDEEQFCTYEDELFALAPHATPKLDVAALEVETIFISRRQIAEGATMRPAPEYEGDAYYVNTRNGVTVVRDQDGSFIRMQLCGTGSSGARFEPGDTLWPLTSRFRVELDQMIAATR